MTGLKQVIELSYKLLCTPLPFGGLTLTPIGIMIGLFCLSVVIYFISKLFD